MVPLRIPSAHLLSDNGVGIVDGVGVVGVFPWELHQASGVVLVALTGVDTSTMATATAEV